MSDKHRALSGPDDVTAAADALTAAADALHKRLMRELARNALAPAQARRLADDEQLLRAQAGGMYADAAALVALALPLEQARLIAAVGHASARIARLEKLNVLLALGADLAALAGAIIGRKPSGVLAAVKKLRADSAAWAKL